MTGDTDENPASILQRSIAQPSAQEPAQQPTQQPTQQPADRPAPHTPPPIPTRPRPAPSLRVYARYLSITAHTETLYPKAPSHPFHARRRLDDRPEGVVRKNGDGMDKSAPVDKTGYNEDGMEEGKNTDKA